MVLALILLSHTYGDILQSPPLSFFSSTYLLKYTRLKDGILINDHYVSQQHRPPSFNLKPKKGVGGRASHMEIQALQPETAVRFSRFCPSPRTHGTRARPLQKPRRVHSRLLYRVSPARNFSKYNAVKIQRQATLTKS